MIKIRPLLEDANAMEAIRELAQSKGFVHVTYRGDIDADRINTYSPKERREHGIFTTPMKEAAAVYARDKEPRMFYVKAKKILDLTKDTMEHMRWVMKWGESFDDWTDRQSGEPTDAWSELSGGRMFDYEGDWSTERWIDIQATAESQGYDAIILPDHDNHLGIFPSFVVFDEKNLKLADPITYDDNEQPILVQHRFNAASDDIRY